MMPSQRSAAYARVTPPEYGRIMAHNAAGKHYREGLALPQLFAVGGLVGNASGGHPFR